MKKFTVITLMLVLAISYSAMANPFSDVPFSHWAYDAVASLSSKGIITGFPDGTFKGQRNVTRYELAMILARLLAKMDTPGEAPSLSSDDRKTVERLTVELADELSLLGVKVTALEDEVAVLKDDVSMLREGHGSTCSQGTSMGGLNVSGEYVLDYNDFDYDTSGAERGFRNFYYLNLEAKPSNDIRIHVQFFNNDLDWLTTAGADVPRNDLVKLSYIEMKNFDMFGLMNFDKATFGRQNYKLGNGLLFNMRETGIVLESEDFDFFMFNPAAYTISDMWGIDYRLDDDMGLYYGQNKVAPNTTETVMGLTYDMMLDDEISLGIEYASHDWDTAADDGTGYKLDFNAEEWQLAYTVNADGLTPQVNQSLATDDTCLMGPIFNELGFGGNVEDMFLKYNIGDGMSFMYEDIAQETGASEATVMTLGVEKEMKPGVDFGFTYSMIEDTIVKGTLDDVTAIAAPGAQDTNLIKFQMRVNF